MDVLEVSIHRSRFLLQNMLFLIESLTIKTTGMTQLRNYVDRIEFRYKGTCLLVLTETFDQDVQIAEMRDLLSRDGLICNDEIEVWLVRYGVIEERKLSQR